ncbi:MAG TPA: hypothetical protein DCL48_00750, partial [Alphaproteobacteria bacterium]|nr:hypothetical protein [Alphaproteobacteria bacterium]
MDFRATRAFQAIMIRPMAEDRSSMAIWQTNQRPVVMIRRERHSYGLKRRLAILIGLAGLSAYAIGLVAFIGALERIGSEPKSADAIVALTGGDARLDKAMSLLAERRGARLLITGVNNTVTRDELKRQIDGPRRVYACCVDLGRGASNTIENA